MPRYFLHLIEGDETTIDAEGIELPGLAAAEFEARREARAVIAADIIAGCLALGGRIEVECNELIVATIHFRDTVKVAI